MNVIAKHSGELLTATKFDPKKGHMAVKTHKRCNDDLCDICDVVKGVGDIHYLINPLHDRFRETPGLLMGINKGDFVVTDAHGNSWGVTKERFGLSYNKVVFPKPFDYGKNTIVFKKATRPLW